MPSDNVGSFPAIWLIHYLNGVSESNLNKLFFLRLKLWDFNFLLFTFDY